MAKVKFAVGQIVNFMREKGDTNVPAGRFTILRVMPIEGTRRDYRVRSLQDGQERVLPEAQLESTGNG